MFLATFFLVSLPGGKKKKEIYSLGHRGKPIKCVMRSTHLYYRDPISLLKVCSHGCRVDGQSGRKFSYQVACHVLKIAAFLLRISPISICVHIPHGWFPFQRRRSSSSYCILFHLVFIIFFNDTALLFLLKEKKKFKPKEPVRVSLHCVIGLPSWHPSRYRKKNK